MASAVDMTNHHLHEALARDRAEHIRRNPRVPQPPRDWSAFAPALSVVAGVLGLLAIAAPSL
jgi:hypothetical protein